MNSTSHLRSDGNLSVYQLSLLAILASASLLCLLAIIGRGLASPGFREFPLWLTGLTGAMLLVATMYSDNLIVQVARHAFAALASAALVVWSPSFAFGLAVVTPLILTVVLPPLLRQTGFRLTLVPELPELAEQQPLIESAQEVPISSSTFAEEPEQDLPDEPADEDELAHDEDDPWSTVREQFDSDESLCRNIATWQDTDGNWSLVANVRCRFSSSTETCVVHLPIWPIPAQCPEVFARVAQGPAASIKTTDIHPHGVRLEVKLTDPGQAKPVPDVLLEVVASITDHHHEAAA